MLLDLEHICNRLVFHLIHIFLYPGFVPLRKYVLEGDELFTDSGQTVSLDVMWIHAFGALRKAQNFRAVGWVYKPMYVFLMPERQRFFIANVSSFLDLLREDVKSFA